MKLEDIYEDDLIDRFEQDLTPIELHFLHYEDNELNTCNKCNIIKNTWDTDEFKWDCDHDLKGHTALCSDCYFELGCKSFYEIEEEVKIMTITVGDYVKTTKEYNSLCFISGEVIEDYGNKVIIIDDCAETDDDRLEFHKSDLEIVTEY